MLTRRPPADDANASERSAWRPEAHAKGDATMSHGRRIVRHVVSYRMTERRGPGHRQRSGNGLRAAVGLDKS